MIVGILLAAGAARRFGGDKLLAELSTGQKVAEVSCRRLLPAVDRVIAVVRPGSEALVTCLSAAGAETCVCAEADSGIGHSLAFAVSQAPQADGWLIALADMPLVATEDVRRVADALRDGAAIAVPVAGDHRGHPVGFARRFFAELSALSGDHGARRLLTQYADEIVDVPVADAQTWQDIDTVEDLAAARRAATHRRD